MKKARNQLAERTGSQSSVFPCFRFVHTGIKTSTLHFLLHFHTPTEPPTGTSKSCSARAGGGQETTTEKRRQGWTKKWLVLSLSLASPSLPSLDVMSQKHTHDQWWRIFFSISRKTFSVVRQRRFTPKKFSCFLLLSLACPMSPRLFFESWFTTKYWKFATQLDPIRETLTLHQHLTEPIALEMLWMMKFKIKSSRRTRLFAIESFVEFQRKFFGRLSRISRKRNFCFPVKDQKDFAQKWLSKKRNFGCRNSWSMN